MDNKIFCLVGPSGAGKDSLRKEIPLPSVKSYRTRPKREWEKEGIDGYFIDNETFKNMHDQWIAWTEYAGHYYGITEKELQLLSQTSLIYVVDWPGVLRLKQFFQQSPKYKEDQIVPIYIYASKQEITERMALQGRTPEEIQARLKRLEEDYNCMTLCSHVIFNREGQYLESLNELYRIILSEIYK